jgi:RNA polymerase sigma-70 factor (ECF subfamily)
MTAERYRLFNHAMDKLTKRKHTAVSFKYAGGLRNTEIAAVMGTSEKNAGVILCRSLKKMRNIIEKEANHEEHTLRKHR